jgi:hypothetical protein
MNIFFSHKFFYLINIKRGKKKKEKESVYFKRVRRKVIILKEEGTYVVRREV